MTPLHAPRGSVSLVVVLRAILVALAALALATAVVARSRPIPAPTTPHRYTCPMHAEITAATPGDCPICGMALAEAATTTAATAPAGATGGARTPALAEPPASPEATALLRYSVAQVRRNALPGEVHAPAVATASGAIVAQLYRDELASLGSDERADFVPSATPGAPIAVRRDAAPPTYHDAIAHVAFRAAPGVTGPPAGQVGWIKLAYKTRAALAVRSTAILASPDGPYVLVVSAQRGRLARRPVEIGKSYAGMTAIVAGLRDKEFVVVANTSAFDAERRLQVAP